MQCAIANAVRARDGTRGIPHVHERKAREGALSETSGPAASRHGSSRPLLPRLAGSRCLVHRHGGDWNEIETSRRGCALGR